MAIRFGKLERLIEIPTGGLGFTLTEGGVDSMMTITAGNKYFLSSGYGAGNTLLADMATIMSFAGGDYTVSITATENGTGLVTIARTDGGPAQFSITWTSTDFRDLLGFTQGNLSGATTYTGASQAKSLWLPDAPLNSLYGPNDAGHYETDGFATESSLGHVKALFGNKKQVNVLVWNGVTRPKVRVAGESRANESFEQFWLDSILGEASWAAGAGGICRLYWDAGVDGTYTDYKIVGEALRTFQAEMMEDGWVGLWNVRLDRCVVVP